MTKVREVMTTSVVTVRSDMTLNEATEVMTSAGVSGTPVIDEHGRLVGIITESDILEHAISVEGKGLSCPTLSFLALPFERMVRDEELCKAYAKVGQTKVKQVMNPEVITISPDDDIDIAMQTMVRFEVNRLPVVEKERLVGIIARQDVLWALCRSSLERGEPSETCALVSR